MLIKRQLILDDYKTAEDGLWTLARCKITKASQVQTFVDVPGRYAPLDLSTALTDGLPYYGSAGLDVVLESSEGTRAERQERIDLLVNRFDGTQTRIKHPDHPKQYLVGRVQVVPEYNDLAHCAVNISAVLEPWFYNADETVAEAVLPYAEALKIGGMTYKDGDTLLSAPVTEVESAGKNWWDNAASVLGEGNLTRTQTGFRFVRGNFAKGTSASYSIPLLKGQTVTFSCVGSEYTPHLYLYKERAYGTNLLSTTDGKLTYTATEDMPTATFTVIINSNNGDNEVSNIQVEFRGSVSPYAPYLRSVLQIPEAVQALEGYGDGLDETCHNYIDWKKKQFVKRVGRVDLGTLVWHADSDPRFSSSTISPLMIKTSRRVKMLCALYEPKQNGELYDVNWDRVIYAAGGSIFIHDHAYTDANALKSALAGVELVFELATPEVVDISNLLPRDNFIGVEGGGTVTFKNEHGAAVPSTLTFTVDSDAEAVEDSSGAYTKVVPGAAVQGPQELTLTNDGRLATVPMIAVDGVVSLAYAGKTRTLSSGVYQLPDLYLTRGEHQVRCEGKGSVNITYREAVLAV